MMFVMVVMLIVLIFAWVMITLVDVLLVCHTLKVSLELTMTLALWERAHLHIDVTASHLGLLIGMTHGDEIVFDLCCQGMAEFLVGHLAATELELDAHLVTFREEIFRVDDLDEVIVGINADTEFEFLQLATLLMLVSFLLVLFLDVLVLAVIDNFAHRGFRTGGDFDEVKTALFGHAKGLLSRENAVLLIGDTIHHTHLRCTDALIDTGLVSVAAVVALGATATGAVERRSTTASAGLVAPRGCGTIDRGTGCASSSWCRSSCRRLRRSRIWIRARAEWAAAQIVEWIANG